MKKKIIALFLAGVFSDGIFSGTAWTEDSAKVRERKSSEYHHNFLWIKIYFRLLKLEKKVGILEESVKMLDEDLDTETVERQSGDRRLEHIIDEEAEIRENMDIALGEAIDHEAAEREMGDERLGKGLADETTARMEADEDLQEQIDSIETGAVKIPIFFTSGPDKIDAFERSWRMGVGHLSLDAFYGIVTPMSGNITDLIGYSLRKPDLVDNKSISFELVVNNRETGLKCEITDPFNCGNQEVSVAVNAGDTLAIKVQTSAGNSASEVGASVVLENTGTQEGTGFDLEKEFYKPEESERSITRP